MSLKVLSPVQTRLFRTTTLDPAALMIVSGMLMQAWLRLTGDVLLSVQQWADGISLSCKGSTVFNNTIIGATDGGIVVFGSPGSWVHGNTGG